MASLETSQTPYWVMLRPPTEGLVGFLTEGLMGFLHCSPSWRPAPF